MHPSLAKLLAYQDRELELERGKKIASHLQNCAGCRSKLRQARAEMERFSRLETSEAAGQTSGTASAAQPDLGAILAGIRRWQAANQSVGGGRPGLDRQIVKELDVYLGTRAATMAGQLPLASGEQGMMSAAEPLLAAFLGRKAASALLDQILEGLAVERELAPEQVG